jgi:formylglycine-generating enzyme required for sulfatase activity
MAGLRHRFAIMEGETGKGNARLWRIESMTKSKSFIAVMLLLVFAATNVLVYGQVEAKAAAKADEQSSAPNKETVPAPGQIADRNRSDSLNPSAIAGKSKADTAITKKKFPWLLVGGLIVAGTVAAVILLKKNREKTSKKIIEPEMVAIPGGTFMMGSNSGEAYSDEQPVHQVTVSGFEIGKYEVTQAEYESMMDYDPSMFIGSRRPVHAVSWSTIQVYIDKLNAATGKKYRLPTEAEWEYACRAGTKGDRYGEVGSIAWYAENSSLVPNEVGGKTPNGFGLYDMLGNVEEWCADWSGPYSSDPQTNPKGPSSGNYRVIRGGSVDAPSHYVRASVRAGASVSGSELDRGFRLVRD